jgi:hypothetical protein
MRCMLLTQWNLPLASTLVVGLPARTAAAGAALHAFTLQQLPPSLPLHAALPHMPSTASSRLPLHCLVSQDHGPFPMACRRMGLFRHPMTPATPAASWAAARAVGATAAAAALGVKMAVPVVVSEAHVAAAVASLTLQLPHGQRVHPATAPFHRGQALSTFRQQPALAGMCTTAAAVVVISMDHHHVC